MKLNRHHRTGFTIVELLIVIIVIAILAAIVIVAYNGITAKAQSSKVDQDIATLVRAINAARINTDKTLYAITGNGCTRCSCPYLSGDTTPAYTLPKTHGCWTAYFNTIDKIATASGANLAPLKAGDPWGSPYSIDENEGESGGCGYDIVESWGRSGNINGGTRLGTVNVSHYSVQCP